MASRTIRLPALHRPLLDVEGRTAVLHAALDCRIHDTALALALRRQGTVVLVTAAVERMRHTINRWRALPVSRKVKGINAGAGRGFHIGDCELWIYPAGNPLDDVPFVGVDSLIVTDAHRVPSSPLQRLGTPSTGYVLMAGEPGPRGGWWSSLLAEKGVDVRRIAALAIVEAFPDQRERMMHEGTPGFRRMMLLEELQEDEDQEDPATVAAADEVPFRVFARRRLFVRTDKDRQFLTVDQVADANAQLGPGWETGQYGTPVLRFQTSPLQNRYLAVKRWARARGFRRFLVLKYRRGGITTVEQGLSYSLCVSQPRVEVATLAHVDDSARRIFRMVKLFADRDPERRVQLVGDSKTHLEFENGSQFHTGTARGTGFGRGETISRFHGSEVSKWRRGPHQIRDVDDLMAGVIAAAGRGEVVLETTADGAEWFCQKYREAKRAIEYGEPGGYFPIFLPWFFDPANRAAPGTFSVEEIRDTLTEDERRLVERHRLSAAQVAWRRQQVKAYGRLFPQEWPEDDESCFLTSGNAYFDVEAAKDRLDDLPAQGDVEGWRAFGFPEYSYKTIPGGYLETWHEPKRGERYVIGVDTSEGLLGGDPNGGGVLRRSDRAQVAAWHGRLPIPAQGEMAAKMSRTYNDALTGIERENHGHAVLQAAIGAGLNVPHYQGGPLYCWSPMKKGKGLRDPDSIARAGWSTNGGTRPRLMASFDELHRGGGIDIVDRLLLSEMLTFHLQEKSGRYEHDPGAHDDCLFKWMIANAIAEVPRRRPAILVVPGRVV